MSRISSCEQRARVIFLFLYMLCAVFAAEDGNAQTRGVTVIKDTAGSEVGLYKESHALVICQFDLDL